MRAATLFLAAAHRQGVTKAFGIIGGEAQAIRFQEVEGLDFYLTRHEFAGGIMADVYARLTGLPQICYSTFGPGLTNLATGICSAALDRSPMLAVSAQVARREMVYNQTHQCIDNVAVVGPMCKFARQLDSVAEIPDTVTEALRIARGEVPGPSYISFPVDLMKEEIDDHSAERLLDRMGSCAPPGPARPDPADLQWLAGEIRRARRPMALAGNLVIREDACAELRAFVERWQVPLVTSLASKGVLPETHPLYIGAVNKYLDGILHHAVLDELFRDCDLMVLIGYDFGEDTKPGQWKRNDFVRSIYLSPNPNPMGPAFQPEREIRGSLKLALPMLAEMAPRSGGPSDRTAIAQLKHRKASSGEAPFQSYPTIPAQAIVRTVRDVIGPDGILCSDIGLHKQYAGLFSDTYEPNTFLCSNGCGTFGFGLPAGMAAKLARPDRRVAVICGDGGFHSTSHDLETAVRYRLPIVVVLLKDNSYGLIKYYQLTDKDTVESNSVDFGDVNFCRLAKANGWDASFVTGRRMLEEKLAQAFEKNRPTLLELPVRYQYKFDPPTA
jgi:acetolactate synthase-1/2/3 large subunit/N2-(2-carboxyethyl)arginine synthase